MTVRDLRHLLFDIPDQEAEVVLLAFGDTAFIVVGLLGPDDVLGGLCTPGETEAKEAFLVIEPFA